MSNFNDNNRKDDMSMEDILASIRKYVAEDENKQIEEQPESEQTIQEDFSKNDPVIKLNETQVVNSNEDLLNHREIKDQNDNREISATYSEVSTLSMNTIDDTSKYSTNRESPFNKLANALNTYGKNKEENKKHTAQDALTIDRFLENLATPIIEKWVSSNISRIVEAAVDREIQKLKND